MRIKTLLLHDYCGYQNAEFKFGDFTCLYGPNGIGKTTILNAVSLLTSSLDFKGDSADLLPGSFKGFTPPTAGERLQAFLKRNIRNVGDPSGCSAFRLEGVFEHEGTELEVFLTEKGFEKNDLIAQPFWWAGLCYFAKFDSDMVNFQLRFDLWPKFKKAYEGITGIQIEPDVYIETDLNNLKNKGECTEYVIGFDMLKPLGRVHSRRGSAGERKIAKALSQVVNLEEVRRPSIVLVDNVEIHVAYTRHLRMIDEMKELFGGMQIVSTTHSPILIEQYQPQEDMVNIEKLLIDQYKENVPNGSKT